jgi:hypothetical protein
VMFLFLCCLVLIVTIFSKEGAGSSWFPFLQLVRFYLQCYALIFVDTPTIQSCKKVWAYALLFVFVALWGDLIG